MKLCNKKQPACRQGMAVQNFLLKMDMFELAMTSSTDLGFMSFSLNTLSNSIVRASLSGSKNLIRVPKVSRNSTMVIG